MNRLCVSMLSVFLCITLPALASIVWANDNNALPSPKVIKVTSQIYAILAPIELPNKSNRGYMANSAAIIGDKGVILIDTGFSEEIGQMLKKTIAGITDKPITHVINTHDHGDHILGNIAFNDATIISSAKCQASMEKAGYEWLGILEGITGLKFPNTKPVVSTQTYAEGTRTPVTLQGVELEIWVPQGSHTANDLMVYLVKDQILIAGDILVKTMIPSFRDAHVQNWITTLEQIAAQPIATIIPGHGGLMNIAEVKQLHQDMQALYTGIEAGYKKGLMDSEIRQTLDLSTWKKRKFFDELMGGNINRTYLEVEAANF